MSTPTDLAIVGVNEGDGRLLPWEAALVPSVKDTGRCVPRCTDEISVSTLVIALSSSTEVLGLMMDESDPSLETLTDSTELNAGKLALVTTDPIVPVRVGSAVRELVSVGIRVDSPEAV